VEDVLVWRILYETIDSDAITTDDGHSTGASCVVIVGASTATATFTTSTTSSCSTADACHYQ
jgi:hypothetical protein